MHRKQLPAIDRIDAASADRAIGNVYDPAFPAYEADRKAVGDIGYRTIADCHDVGCIGLCAVADGNVAIATDDAGNTLRYRTIAGWLCQLRR